jgi:hypothetical protein
MRKYSSAVASTLRSKVRRPRLGLAIFVAAVSLATAARPEEPSRACKKDQVAAISASVTEVSSDEGGSYLKVTDVKGDCFVDTIFMGGPIENCKVGDEVTATGEFMDEFPAIFVYTHIHPYTYKCAR